MLRSSRTGSNRTPGVRTPERPRVAKTADIHGPSSAAVAAGTIAALTLAGGSLAAAPAADADENMYLQQIRPEIQRHLVITDSQLLQLGYVACETMRSNISNGMSIAKSRAQADQAVARTAWGIGLQPGLAGSMIITQEAENNLC